MKPHTKSKGIHTIKDVEQERGSQDTSTARAALGAVHRSHGVKVPNLVEKYRGKGEERERKKEERVRLNVKAIRGTQGKRKRGRGKTKRESD